MCRRIHNSETYTVSQVARALGKSDETIRQWILSPNPPAWGAVIKGKKRSNFTIYKRKFEEITGIIIKEENND